MRTAGYIVQLLLISVCAAFAEPRVRGMLSSPTAAVGEPVEYELVIEGGEAPENAPVPQVDGLEVRGTSQSSQLSFVNGNVSRRVTITYTLVPGREGKFTIPPLEVQLAGRKLATQPQTLTVTPGETMNAAGDLAFGKIWIEKRTAYLGETVPLELRLYLDANERWNLRNSPALSGDGFTVQPMGQPSQRDTELAGKSYHLVTFRTLITPGKAGKLTVGPVPVHLVVSKRARTQPQYRLFGPQFDAAQEITVTVPAIEMQVKPLPAEGRPKDFSGAIGKFKFSAAGTPDRVKIGEPVSMKLRIEGRGNFDRIDLPSLVDPDGWTAYSAKQQFDPGDSLGTGGVKTFDLPVTPNTKKTTMPVFAFSFFDVDVGKYVTLKSEAAPLRVDGEPARLAINPAPKGANEGNPGAPKTGPKAPETRDIVANVPDLGPIAAGFGLHSSPVILFATMFAPLPVILAMVAWRSRRKDDKALRAASLRRERAALLARMRKCADRAELLDAAVCALRIDAALDGGEAGEGSELAQVLRARKLDEGSEKAIGELFEARNELLYAGGARGAERLDDRERDRVLETLANYERSPRK